MQLKNILSKWNKMIGKVEERMHKIRAELKKIKNLPPNEKRIEKEIN